MKKATSFFSDLKYDLPAGIVVFLVALPLCLGMALASGVPLISGIISGIIGGLLVGFLSGSQTSVSGPAAGLVVIVLNGQITLGGFNMFLAATVVAGVIQILLGVIKLGVIGLFFPSPVIRGMLAGIGLTIIFKQLPVLLGTDWQILEAMRFWEPHTNMSWALPTMQNAGVWFTGLLSLAILIVYDLPYFRRIPLFNIIPGSLLAIIISVVLVNVLIGLGFIPPIAASRFVSLPLVNNLNEAKQWLSFVDISAFTNPQVYIIGVTIALVASLETLLSLEAVDKIDKLGRKSPPNRELVAQGFANMVSGVVGGLPITSVIVRSSANIEAGARSKTSAIFHGLLFLPALFIFPQVLNKIPLSALAAILVYVGIKLVPLKMFATYFSRGWVQFVPLVVTTISLLLTDLLTGITIGLTVGIIFILSANFRLPFYLQRKEEMGPNGKKAIRWVLNPNVTFLNKASVQMALNELPDSIHLIIDGRRNRRIDPDVLDSFLSFKANADIRDITVEFQYLRMRGEHIVGH